MAQRTAIDNQEFKRIVSVPFYFRADKLTLRRTQVRTSPTNVLTVIIVNFLAQAKQQSSITSDTRSRQSTDTAIEVVASRELVERSWTKSNSGRATFTSLLSIG